MQVQTQITFHIGSIDNQGKVSLISIHLNGFLNRVNIYDSKVDCCTITALHAVQCSAVQCIGVNGAKD